MLKNLAKNSFWIAIAFCCATQMSYAQGPDPRVQNPFPAGSALINIAPDADGHLTLGGEYKQPKNVVEQEQPVFWTWFVDAGYYSEYNFRGTNLTPGAPGAGFFDAQVTKDNFTLGLFGVHQFGHARADSWSIGEGGGSSTAPFAPDAGPYMRFPTTVQTRFDELDVFLSYKFSLGPIDITLGNIAFFISRDAYTYELDLAPKGFIWIIPFTNRRTRVLGRGDGDKFPPSDPTVEEEVFDRLYIRLSTTKLSKYITPQITYYQTVYSWGAEPTKGGTMFYDPALSLLPPFPPGHFGLARPHNPRAYNERNEALGGYLEGRINGHFPLGKRVDFDPHAILSVSFRDRTEPGGSWPYGGHPYTGFNHVQAGAELPIWLVHLGGFSSTKWAPPDADLFFVPFGDYAYHIGRPTAGTDRNEWWGGGKFELTF
jgi:hypothetical protein